MQRACARAGFLPLSTGFSMNIVKTASVAHEAAAPVRAHAIDRSNRSDTIFGAAGLLVPLLKPRQSITTKHLCLVLSGAFGGTDAKGLRSETRLRGSQGLRRFCFFKARIGDHRKLSIWTCHLGDVDQGCRPDVPSLSADIVSSGVVEGHLDCNSLTASHCVAAVLGDSRVSCPSVEHRRAMRSDYCRSRP